MEKGTGVGWRSALMAPVCFVIRSSVKRPMGGGGGVSGRAERNGTRERRRQKEDRQS